MFKCLTIYKVKKTKHFFVPTILTSLSLTPIILNHFISLVIHFSLAGVEVSTSWHINLFLFLYFIIIIIIIFTLQYCIGFAIHFVIHKVILMIYGFHIVITPLLKCIFKPNDETLCGVPKHKKDMIFLTEKIH